jgi:hypothetical protein
VSAEWVSHANGYSLIFFKNDVIWGTDSVEGIITHLLDHSLNNTHLIGAEADINDQ